MSLLGQLEMQQERCQSTLFAAPLATAKPLPPPAAKFSNDTERLQLVDNIRKSPVGAQIKRVIDLLLETRQALTPEQINEACYVDLNTNKAVFDSLRHNPKVSYDGKRFSYKAKHDLKNKAQLLQLIRKFPEGTGVLDIKDTYPNVMQDLQALNAACQIWVSVLDSQEVIVYPNDPSVLIKADDELKLFYLGTELTRDMIDMEKELQKNGMKPATNTAQRRAVAQIQGTPARIKTKKKERQINKRTKLTNAHLPEIFQILNGS